MTEKTAEQVVADLAMRTASPAVWEEVERLRAALVKAEGERGHYHDAAIALASDVKILRQQREAAEASCREHAEAIVVLRDMLKELTDAAEHDLKSNQDDQNEHAGWWSLRAENAIHEARKILSNPLSSNMSSERKAEREVVRAARALHDEMDADAERGVDWEAVDGMWRALGTALKALPSPASQDDA
jgi:hypothetical protein